MDNFQHLHKYDSNGTLKNMSLNMFLLEKLVNCIYSFTDFTEPSLQTRCFIVLFVSGQKKKTQTFVQNCSCICSCDMFSLCVRHSFISSVKSVTVRAIVGRGGKKDLNINTFKRKEITKPGYNLHLGES